MKNYTICTKHEGDVVVQAHDMDEATVLAGFMFGYCGWTSAFCGG